MTNLDLLKLHIESGSDYYFYRDQMNITYPRSFACIRFSIDGPSALDFAADELRREADYPPCFSGSDADSSAWYNYSITLYEDVDGIRAENAIGAEVCNTDEADEGWVYYIDLTDEQREMLPALLDEQCKEEFGMSLKEMFAIANKDLFGEEAV